MADKKLNGLLEQRLRVLHETLVSRGGTEPWSIDDMRFLTLALVGEAGELANEVKKQWRGDDRHAIEGPFTAERMLAIRQELVDIRAYARLIGILIDFDENDLHNAMYYKLGHVAEKHGIDLS